MTALRVPRVRAALVGATLATLAAWPLALSTRPRVRIPIAPLWGTATLLVSAPQPPVALVLGLVFAGIAAVVYLLWPWFRNVANQAIWLHLAAISIATSLELIFYRPIARSLIRLAGDVGDVGAAFPVFLTRVLLPGTLLYVAFATTAILVAKRYWPGRVSFVLAVLWTLDYVLLSISVMECIRPRS